MSQSRLLRYLISKTHPNQFSGPFLSAVPRRLCSSDYKFDAVVIGSGPGGYVAAIKAAQLGLKTVCVEKNESLGGTCLNVGCIPSKVLLYNSHLYEQARKDLERRGIQCEGGVKLDLQQMMEHKSSIVNSLTSGVAQLFKKNGVKHIRGHGKITGQHEVTVKTGDGSEKVLTTRNIVIATGSEVTPLPGVKIDEEHILSSTGALSLKKVPERLVLIGAGIIGLEMGCVWKRLGSRRVTAIDSLHYIGGWGMDEEVSEIFQRILTRQGLQFLLNATVTKVSKRFDKQVVSYRDSEGETKSVECDAVLVCVGRRPYTANLGLDTVGIETHRGHIKVNKQLQTSVPHIYAIGDCSHEPMLAHKASDEGLVCAENMAGKFTSMDYRAIPSVIYTLPEVAWVGQNEHQLQNANVPYKVGRFPMGANSRGRCNDVTDGFVKVLSEETSDEILGVHMVCLGAGELINEAALAMSYGATAESVSRVCHAHPTFSEALREACLAASFGKPINY